VALSVRAEFLEHNNTTKMKIMTTEIETEITFGRERHRLVHQRHGELKARRLNPDLARLAEEILERDNLCMGEAEIATYLAEPLESGRRGHTVKSVVADAASRRAARASQTAEESGDDDLSAHGDASDAHKEAARKHRAAAAYHDDCAAFHSEKANPKKIGADQTPGEPIDCARSLPHLLGNDASVPDVIQYMPGGTHTITPSRAGKPVTVTVLVDETTAARLEQQRQILEASGNKPFFSVQHNTQVAAFWPSRFFWDTRPDVTGKMVEGVWAEGEWTAAGREAVAGKNFRTFSPTFFVNGVSTDPDKPAEVVCNENAKLNMGALENDPAFTTISPLWKNPQPQA
jgi:hypothetical protein